MPIDATGRPLQPIESDRKRPRIRKYFQRNELQQAGHHERSVPCRGHGLHAVLTFGYNVLNRANFL